MAFCGHVYWRSWFERTARGGSLRSTMWLLRRIDRKSTRLNSSHLGISYAVFCLKKQIIITIHDGVCFVSQMFLTDQIWILLFSIGAYYAILALGCVVCCLHVGFFFFFFFKPTAPPNFSLSPPPRLLPF